MEMGDFLESVVNLLFTSTIIVILIVLANDPVLPDQHLSMSDPLELAEDELSEALKHIEHAIAMSVVYGQVTEDGDDDQGTTETD